MLFSPITDKFPDFFTGENSEDMKNQIFCDADSSNNNESDDIFDMINSLNLPSPQKFPDPIEIDTFDLNSFSFLDEVFSGNDDVKLSDVAGGRRSTTSEEENEIKTEDDDDDDDSNSLPEQITIKSAYDGDHSYLPQQNSVVNLGQLTSTQKDQYRKYFSSKPHRETVFIDREVIVGGRRPKKSTSPLSLTSTEMFKSRGALYAKQYRQKNKECVDRMQNELDRLSEENQDLKETVEDMSGKMTALQDEVAYLRNILANDSQLSVLLKNVTTANTPGTKFRFPVAPQEDNRRVSTRKRKQPNSLVSDSETKKNKNSLAGVCLHVNGDCVSVEFCSRCSADAARCDD